MDSLSIRLDPRYYIYSATGAGENLLLLVDWYETKRGAYAVGVLKVDVESGAVTGPVELWAPGGADGMGVLAASDAEPVAIVAGLDGRHAVYRLDAATMTAVRVPVAGLMPYIYGAAVSNGLLYVAGLTGAQVIDLDTGVGRWLGSADWTALHPAASGIEAMTPNGLATYDVASGVTTVAPVPDVGGFADLSPTKRLFGGWQGGGYTPVVLDLADDSWHLTDNPCTPMPSGLSTEVGDRVYSVPWFSDADRVLRITRVALDG